MKLFAVNQYNLIINQVQQLDKNKKYRLLEIGAGAKILKKFLPKNVLYESLDFGEHDFNFNLDRGKFPIKKDTYDIIVCLETLEHVLYPERVIKEIIRVAKKDAIFFFSLPNEYNFVMRFYYLMGIKTEVDEIFQITEKHLHIHKPRVKDILNLFSKYFKIIEVDYIWQSRTSVFYPIVRLLDKIINLLAKINPSLFARCVSIKAKL
jgi:SAM-dependent methyltransferase